MEVRKVAFAETWQPGEIDFDLDDARICQVGPLRAEGEAELLPHTGRGESRKGSHKAGSRKDEPGNEVRVHGKVETTLETDCDRCLGRAKFPIAASFDLFYRPVDVEAIAEEVAIDEGEAEMGFYELPGLVLEDILREQLLLQLPMQRVCSESCKGICPVCGVNRNEVPCSCDTVHPLVAGREAGIQAIDERWKALQSLKVQ